ncbi:sigma-54-dependent transcriptional regulator [Engelhardtia mirabilis]|uniref:Transcriptional regulatory protein ZraR n=1 Tax=Engelhardtia mirabilis TaxID=2528011 RepID=A0A518BKF3_9BACT|nr:Transcriptional regulatory protein ZraR [Planctomycetes bacterium Pla133]QDV01771.1 Transcriptional regulatory protein ZraR [Planctomycetes bacterium Pla86]
MKILLAEDEVTIAVTLTDSLTDAGHQVVHVSDTDAALASLEADAPDLVLTDIRMPGKGGMAVLERSVALDPTRAVILITGYASVDQAVEAMSKGAAWYVQKPFRNDAVVDLVGRFGRSREIEAENRELKQRLQRLESIEGLVGASPAMQKVFDRLRTVAPTEATVLIEGESGTGKERVALALHRLSSRPDGPFIALSCAALPESLLEAELFGHEKGAFTDAHREKKGRVELAGGGTLFLDDIDDMPLTVQVKLLRVLQERTFERLGSERTQTVDMRVIAATKVPLREAVRGGTFREDLFYRINVVPLPLPPLRDRAGDVALLAQAMIERYFQPRTAGEAPPTIARTTLQLMERYPWPGNVRELENAIQRALALRGDGRELAREHLLPIDDRWRGATEVPETIAPLREVLREAEAEHLRRALELTGGHRTQSAELLGISRKVLWEKLKDHGIDVEE